MFRKLTPVLIVDAIEPCLTFWIHRLGFENKGQVPEGDRIGFVILQAGAVEVMYQTWSSVETDLGRSVQRGIPSTGLYIEVESIDEVVAKLGDYPIALPRRQTFYGMEEIGVRDPGGSLVMFACRLPAAA